MASPPCGAGRGASDRCARAWPSSLVSKLYRQMYANTGIATDSARVSRSVSWARWIAKPLRRLFAGRPLPDLQVPVH